MGPLSVLYRSAQSTLRLFTPVLGRGSSKLARGLAGRRGAHRRLARWGRERRDPGAPCVWFHAPSVGEGLQALAVIEALREARPEVQIVFTHFSPSAETLAARMPADAADYLPWDLTSPMRTVLNAVRPDVVAFTKTEVWPVLVAESERLSIPTALVGGSLTPGAGRAKWPATALLRPTWSRLSLVGAIDGEDRLGFADLGVRADIIHVTGDPGIDSAAARARSADPEAPYLEPFHRAPLPTVVAGSTWPADEEVLFPALRDAKARIASVRVVVAPHEPTPLRVRELVRRLGAGGWRPVTLSEMERSGLEGRDAVVVDRVGALAHLYTVATIAYVGGGFHGAGLHSVLEPAAAGVPVLFGPGHGNARAAEDLVGLGGGRVGTDRAGLADVLVTWLLDPSQRDYAGAAARGYIDRHTGAADRSARLLLSLIDSTPGSA